MREDRNSLDKVNAKFAKKKGDFATFYLTRHEGQARRKVMLRNINIARR
jgi:hypothetical protein